MINQIILKKYLELPVFDNNYNLKKNIIFYKKWDNYSKKLEDKKKVLRLHDYFLGQLTTFLNKYHNRNYSKKILVNRFKPMVI